MELKEKFPYESDEKIKKDAFILTKKRVALPGKSEHQTGLAIDITCFYNGNYDEDISINNEVEWMKDNAHKFGFILRYPKVKEDITGYIFEPWHYRYVGNNYSYDITNDNLTLEEYYEIVLKK